MVEALIELELGSLVVRAVASKGSLEVAYSADDLVVNMDRMVVVAASSDEHLVELLDVESYLKQSKLLIDLSNRTFSKNEAYFTFKHFECKRIFMCLP